MLSDKSKKQITVIWDSYVESNRTVLDTRGRLISDIDDKRLTAIEELKRVIEQFKVGYITLSEFKTTVDGFNKRNNLWGFTATKGQMFFNQLTKTYQNSLSELAALISVSIAEPNSLEDALLKIENFEKFLGEEFANAKDKRKVPNPGSIGYFLSYFWQIHDNRRWPLIYTSLTRCFDDLGIWNDPSTQSEAYRSFYVLNEEIKSLLSSHTNSEITNWDAEHAFWHHSRILEKITGDFAIVQPPQTSELMELEIGASFEISDYLIPKVTKLTKLGCEAEKSKAVEYEKLVSEIFRLLDFEVEVLGQGSGRNPDAILRFREEHTAFIIDAKAYSDGYGLGASDDRAIREYINYHCPKLIKEGFRRIGFIVVSNAFKSSLDEFANDITWCTDVKRFILLTSEALLYLLAYKTKDKLSLSSIIETLISNGNMIRAQDVIQKFDDI